MLAAALVALALLGAGASFVGGPRPLEAGASSSLHGVAVDTGFRPSKNGFSFKNTFCRPDANWFVKLGGGRCGGMAYAALDHFFSEETPGTKCGDGALIARRNLDSIVGNGARFVAWTAWPVITAGLAPDVETLTRTEELPRLAAALNDGPVALGLLRTQDMGQMKRNHQVVAYAMETGDGVARIHIYDPNHPLADDVVLDVPLDGDGPIVSRRSTVAFAEWRGLFVERYATGRSAE